MIDLELCKRYWHRIYHIERRGIYSFCEIEKLVNDLERIVEICPDPERLIEVLDECYLNMDSPILVKRIVLINHLRSIFHRPLKQLSVNPLTSDKQGKLMKLAIQRTSKLINKREK